MKKRLLSLALVLAILVSTAFANTAEGVNAATVAAFKKDFAAAQDVKWESNKEFNKATFKLNGQVMFAYYSLNGDLVALSRNLTTSQIPISLAAELKKASAEYWITDLFEMASNDETTYYATIQNADQVIVLKSVGSSAWDVYKKTKKQ
jgi:hypothetical protein